MQFKFKPGAEPACISDDPFYALNEGYIVPSALLEDAEQIKAVTDAVDLITDFLSQARDAEMIEYL